MELDVLAIDVSGYLQSPEYEADLAAAGRVWGRPLVLETAGVFVFLTYLTLPALLDVRSVTGSAARSALDGERERAFLLYLLGFTDDVSWRDGIRNPRVRQRMTSLYAHHSRFPGMQPEYLDFIAAAMSLAPLRVWAAAEATPRDGDRSGYWRYMRHAVSLLGAGIVDEQATQDRCAAFIEMHAAPSPEGRRLLKSLAQHHPRYVELAIPILFKPSQSTVHALFMEH